MWKLHRYYLKEVGVNALLSFVVLFGIALLSLLFKGLRLVQGGELIDAVLTTLLLTADIFPHLLTFSLMFGTVLTFARASQEREITAIRALGISPRVPMVASMLIGLLCSLVDAWALHYEIPWAHYHKYRVVADIWSSQIEKHLKSRDRIELEGGDGVMTWQKKVPESIHDQEVDVYHGVSIYMGQEGAISRHLGGGRRSGSIGRVGTLVVAEKAWFVKDVESNAMTLEVRDYYVPSSPSSMTSQAIAIQIDLVKMLKGTGDRLPNDKDLRSDALLAEVARGVHADPPAARYTVHRRAAFALIPFLLAPIGFCIGVLSRERGRVLALSFCMVPLAVIYLTDFLGESLMRTFQVPLIAWLPAVVTVLGGTPFCWRLLRI